MTTLQAMTSQTSVERRVEMRKRVKQKEGKQKKYIFHDDYQFANPEIKDHLHVPQEIWRIK